MFEHISVLREEAVKGLNIKPDGLYVDCTVGGGGHAELILSKLSKAGSLIAFDQDENALLAAKKRLHNYSEQTTFINKNFKYLEEELTDRGIDRIDGILFDLGVSSPQLDEGERGFSYHYNAKLDMRMNQKDSLTAHEVVNNWSYDKLVRIFFTYGEEKFSRQIARKIESYRESKAIDTTFELVEIIKDAIPAPARRKGGHPAKRVFQAIRIAVNDELTAFQNSLHQAAKLINIQGRISVITFHSLEDRLCKQAFRKWSTVDLPPKLPIIPEGFEAPFKLITRRPIVASKEELANNRRARSARLRVVEKTKEWNKDFKYEEGWKY